MKSCEKRWEKLAIRFPWLQEERVDDKCARKLRAIWGEKIGREFSWHLIKGEFLREGRKNQISEDRG